ncbi:MAG: nucleoside deaminase [Defluviitaleaceae bacterium]|nr:nucleoside deaminase [Defluviitaleaceae bacterium]
MTPNEKMAFVIGLAKEALSKGELPIAAAVYHGDELVSSAYTTEREDGRFLVHAEQKALYDADMQKLPYLVRTKLELYTNLEPCLMCLGMAISSFVGKIYYSLEAPEDGATDVVKMAFEKRPSEIWCFPKVNAGLFREESIRLFGEYVERNQGNTEYSAGLIKFAKTLTDL